jgi:hypothetical protein
MMRQFVVSTLLLSSACVTNHGTRPDEFPPANSPEGVHVALRVRGESSDRVGELLAADSIGLTVRGQNIIRVAWSKVDALDVAGAGDDLDIWFGENVPPEKRARLALVSRFPQGMNRLPIRLDSLIAETSRETTRFGERRVAVIEGYRRVGADFPGMGEHWVNVAALLRNTVDPAKPAILTYATIAGRPTLLGAGFVVVTHADSMPREIPGWPGEWHEHSGLLADESAALVGKSRPDSSTHVWVMHVWTTVANPAGALAADNWSLPFVRAGIPSPAIVDADAGRAMSLTVGGDDFLRDVLTDAELRTPHNAAVVDSTIGAARLQVMPSSGRQPDITALRNIWAGLASSLERTVGPGVREIVSSSHRGRHPESHP